MERSIIFSLKDWRVSPHRSLRHLQTMREVENTLWAENAEYIADRYYEKWQTKRRKHKLYLTYPKSQTLSDLLTRSDEVAPRHLA